MLYICATPIGNLSDITIRAIEVLNASDIILCEDTRNSKHLLNHHQILFKQLVVFHEHNESEMTEKVLIWLSSGLTITLITDAGTPGVSDPGGRLCKKVLELGYKLSPLPGASAFVSLLSVAGLDMPLLFKGFLPSQKLARQRELQKIMSQDYAVSIYEAPHRIVDCIGDIIIVFGESCQIIMGRELTKRFETIKRSRADELLEFIKNDSNQQKGEFVLIVIPTKNEVESILTSEQINVLKILLPDLPPKKAVLITHKICGGDKNLLYQHALNIRNKAP